MVVVQLLGVECGGGGGAVDLVLSVVVVVQLIWC